MSSVPTLPPLRGTLPLVLALAYTASTHAAPGNPVQRFDDAVSRGLPQRIALTHDRLSRSTVDDMLHVGARVDGVDVTFSDGTIGTHYTATWHGKPAIATRSGDHLDITVTDNDMVDVTGFSMSSDSAHHFRHGTPAAPPGVTSRSGEATPPPAPSPQPVQEGVQGPYTVIAHEFGHTLGGTHDDAEVDWSGYWPCETNLYWNASPLRSNCYRYTTANQRRMRDYMAGEHPVGGVRRFEMVD